MTQPAPEHTDSEAKPEAPPARETDAGRKARERHEFRDQVTAALPEHAFVATAPEWIATWSTPDGLWTVTEVVTRTKTHVVSISGPGKLTIHGLPLTAPMVVNVLHAVRAIDAEEGSPR